MRFLLASLVLVAGAWAQDTYNCPDGWMLEEDRSGCRCFMLSEGESVTRDDADILCAFHEAWVAELDHPGLLTWYLFCILYMGLITGINYWLKSQLLAITEPGDWNQFWLGAKTTVSHFMNFRSRESFLFFRAVTTPTTTMASGSGSTGT